MNTSIRKLTRGEKAARTRRRNKVKAAKKLLPFTCKDQGKPWRRIYPGGREVLNLRHPLGRDTYKLRTLLMAERQGWKCALTGKQLTEENVTFDHEAGRGAGGGRRDDRTEIRVTDPETGKARVRWINAAVTYEANMAKGSKRTPYLPHARGPK